jgi:hypothetical protein
MGHSFSKHLVLDVNIGHLVVLTLGAVIITLLRDLTPSPHFMEQSFQLLHRDVEQAVGHSLIMHGRMSFKFPHATLVLIGLTSTARDRDIIPAPHGLSHFPHLAQAETLHSVEHGPRSHFCFSLREEQTFPPNCGARSTVLMRAFSPAPHSSEQAPNGCHCDISQSTAHGFELH